MFVKSLGAWNIIVANIKSDTQLSRRVAKQRHSQPPIVHPSKYLPQRSFILRKMMMLSTNFTGVQVRTLEMRFEPALMYFVSLSSTNDLAFRMRTSYLDSTCCM